MPPKDAKYAFYDTKTTCFAVAKHKWLKEMWDAYDYNSWLQLCQETAILSYECGLSRLTFAILLIV